MMTAMVRTLGIHCDPRHAYIAVVEDGAVIDCGKHRERLSVPASEQSQALNALLEDTVQLIRALEVVGVSILPAETADPSIRRNPASLTARNTLETVMRLAAVRAGVPVEVTARATARARLGLPRTGKLDSHLGTIFPYSAGEAPAYWTTGRGLAAMAALSLGKI
jgi:hypothetical protein